ncbi:MAG: hypothetical protein IJW67_11080 [Blautia sp.]|nr:hypothetical protein [Blautia sp.]
MKRELRDLLKVNKKVWVCLDTPESRKQFVSEMAGQKAMLTNGDLFTMETCGNIMSLTPDGKLAYVSMMAWAASFRPESETLHHNFAGIPKIDYAAWMEGREDYLIERNRYRRVG